MEEEDLINSSPVLNTSPSSNSKPVKSKVPVIKDDKFVNTIWSNQPRENYNSPLGSISSKISSNYHGQNTGVGKSTFDDDLLWGTDIDDNDVAGSLNEYRYNQQGWGLQVGAGIARAGTKAASEILKLPGVVVGGIAAPFTAEGEGYDTAFNNQWIKAIDNLNETINTEALPVYVGKAVKEGNLWDNITSTSFWATEGADGLGFLIGMMAPGAIINKLSVGAKLVNGVSKTAKLLNMTESLETGINGLTKIGFNGAKSIDMGLGVAANTIFEAGAEAKSLGDTMDAQKEQYLANYPAQQLKKLQSLDVRRRNGEITIDEYNKLSADISNKTAEDSFKEQRAIAMADNFKMNLGILLGPNLLMHQAVWGRAARRIESIATTGRKATLSRVGNSAKRWGQAFLSEGLLEEGGQSTSEELFRSKAMKGELSRSNNFLGDFSVGDLTNGYLDMISTTEGQKAIFLGGVLGGPLMSYQGRKQDLRDRTETNAILDRTNNAISGFNTIFTNDIYKKNEDGSFVYEKDEDGNDDITKKVYDPVKIQEIAIANHFTEERSREFEEAVRNGDQEVVNEIKQQAIFDLVLPSIYNRNGGLETMRQQLAASQEFQEIIARDNIPNNTEKSSDFVKDILKSAEYLQLQQEKFENFSKDIIELNDDRATAQDKETYLNKLSVQYLKTKFNQYNAEKNLNKLKKDRQNLLEDFGISDNLVTEDERLVSLEQTSPLLKAINDQIRETEALINKNKKDVNELWLGRDLINQSFSNYIDGQIRESERLSPENVDKADAILDAVNQAQTRDELEAVVNENKKETLADTPILENPLVQQVVSEKEQALEAEENEILDNLEEENDFIARDAREEDDIQDLTDVFGEESNDTTVQEDVVEIEKDTDVSDDIDDDYEATKPEKPLTVIPDTDIILDGNPSTTIDDEIPANGEEVANKIEKTLKTQQTGVKLVSTIRNRNSNKNGQKLDFISQEFLDYERNGKDKINTPVNFKIADYTEGLAGEALNIINNNSSISYEDRQTLYDHLPIQIVIKDSNGNNVESFIEARPFKGASKQANRIYEDEVLPLRKLIVDAIITGTDINKLSSHVIKQFPGVLQVDPQVLLEDGRLQTPVNSIKDLQFFKNFEGNLLAEIAKRSYFVDYDGQLTSVNNRLDKKGDQHNGFGEVFLEIPQNNGKPFMLKLNYKALDSDKANVIFEIFKALSSVTPTIENPNIQSISINDFLTGLDPDTRLLILDGLASEIKLVNDLQENSADRTLERLLSYVIHQNSTNSRTRIKLNKNGTLLLGDLSPVSRITKDQLLSDDPQYRQIVVDFLQKKRHNVLITKDNQATFQNPVYLNYLLDNDILSTNAVVNEPTFQGYSNIYISNNIKGINEPINSELATDLSNNQLNTTASNTRNLETVEKAQTSQNNYDLISVEEVIRPNGSIGTQGFTEENLVDLIKFISNKMNFNIPVFDKNAGTSEIRQLIEYLRQDQNAQNLILDYVKSDPVEMIKLPDDTYHLKDGNHRANLLNLIGVSEIPIQNSSTKVIEQTRTILKSEEDQVMELLDKFEDWNLDISLIDTTQSPQSIISQISNIIKDNEAQSSEFEKICGL